MPAKRPNDPQGNDRGPCVHCTTTAEDCRNKIRHDHKKCCSNCNHPIIDNTRS